MQKKMNHRGPTKKLRANTVLGKRVYFWWNDEGVLRGAYGNFKGYSPGGLAEVWFEHTAIVVQTLPAAVEVL